MQSVLAPRQTCGIYRPYISVLFLFGVVALVSQWSFYHLSDDICLCVLTVVLVCCMLGAYICFIRKTKSYTRGICLFFMSCCISILSVGIAFAHTKNIETGISTLEKGKDKTFVIQTMAISQKDSFYYKTRVNVYINTKCLGAVVYTKQALEQNKTYRICAYIKPFRQGVYKKTMLSQGICGELYAYHVQTSADVTSRSFVVRQHQKLRQFLLKQCAPQTSQARSLIASTVLNQRDASKTLGVEALFNICGLTHLIAISGSHLLLIVDVLVLFFQRRKYRFVVQVGFLLVTTAMYIILCDTPVSALRAWCMLFVCYIGKVLGRGRTQTATLGCIACMVACIYPQASNDMGYLFSFFSASVLVLFGEYVFYIFFNKEQPTKTKVQKGIAKIKKIFSASILVSLTLNCFTIPVFHQFSLIAPLANILIVPLFSCFCVLAFICVFLSWIPVVGLVCMHIASLAAWCVIACVRMLAHIPYASVLADMPWYSVYILLFAACVVLGVWKLPQNRKRIQHMIFTTMAVSICVFLCTYVFLATRLSCLMWVKPMPFLYEANKRSFL